MMRFLYLLTLSTWKKKLENIDWDYLSLHCDGVCPKEGGDPYLLSGSTAAYFITRERCRKNNKL